MTRRTGLVLILLLAAFAYLWQLGSSSLFVDEALSLNLVGGNLPDIFDGLRRLETSPPAYSFFLKAWVEVAGSSDEWVARLPSALAMVGVVAVIFRIASLVAGRKASVAAGLLAAVSPLLLAYAQQARPYALLALASALAVLCGIEAERLRSRPWLVGCAVAAVAALWLHYTALLVVGPLSVWVAYRTPFDRRTRTVFCGVQVVAFLVWAPLLREQFQAHPNGGLSVYGELSLSHAVRVIGSPFDTRYDQGAAAPQVIGAAVVVAALALVGSRVGRARRPREELVFALALLAPLALLALSIAGKDLLVTRYAVASVPFLIVVIGMAVASLRTPVALALLAVSLAAAGVGMVRSHREAGFFADTRAVAHTLDAGWQRGDTIVLSTDFGVFYVLSYYIRDRLPPGTAILAPKDPRVAAHVRGRGRLWVITFDTAGSRASVPLPRGYRRVRSDHLAGALPLRLSLAEATR